MKKQQTRVGTIMLPHVYSSDGTPARISMTIHLAERKRWRRRCKRPVYINYAHGEAGCVVQFEATFKQYDYVCQFSLKQLHNEHFKGCYSPVLAEFARKAGVRPDKLLLEAVTHGRELK